MTKLLLIYDQNGTILNQTFGDVIAPESLRYMLTEVPDGQTVHHVDVSDPENPHLVFQENLEFNFGKLMEKMEQISLENNNLKAQLEATQDALTKTQLALVGEYENKQEVSDDV